MKITKTTINFAARRGIEIYVHEGDKQVWFSQIDEEGEAFCEPFMMYNDNDDCLTYHGNIYLPKEIKEEIPVTIFSEKQLKEVIKFLAEELKNI